MTAVPVLRTVAALRTHVRAWRSAGDTIALIPTMGALHRGHMALVAAGRQCATRAISTIFVNPTQFAPTEDFAAYPRSFDDDLAKLAEAGADACFAPSVEEMYPAGFSATVMIGGPATAGLEDRFRPSHFSGVATVVAKLLGQAQPDIALFGEKDFQQLLVIRAMARDLDIACEIVGIETIREDDGFALSSRNLYLMREERVRAPELRRALLDCAKTIAEGAAIVPALASARRRVEEAGFVVDYLEARHAETLAPVANASDGPLRLLVAARLGRTRLIDNLAVGS